MLIVEYINNFPYFINIMCEIINYFFNLNLNQLKIYQ